jgi:hypothetical protein
MRTVNRITKILTLTILPPAVFLFFVYQINSPNSDNKNHSDYSRATIKTKQVLECRAELEECQNEATRRRYVSTQIHVSYE